MLIVVSCNKYDDSDLWDKLNDTEERVTALEKLCQQFNTEINAIQKIVNSHYNNIGITKVENNENGYTIHFSDGTTAKIYNGKDGTNGKDGQTPIIGVKQHSDGIHYWTINSDWLLDSDNNKIKAIGINGTDGENGITPKLKIENGRWMLSMDNESTWTDIGRATGESESSMFSDVDYINDDYVTFTLTDGTILSVPKHKGLSINFTEGVDIHFGINETKTLNYTITGGSNKVVAKTVFTDLEYYNVQNHQTNATSGKITITSKNPIKSEILVFVSDGTTTIMSIVNLLPLNGFFDNVLYVETEGTASTILASHDKSLITNLKVVGNINSSDISFFRTDFPRLSVLDLEDTNLKDGLNLLSRNDLTEIVLPKGLIKIENHAFFQHFNLTGTMTIPNSVENIGEYAFTDCKGLTSLIIGNNIKTIGLGSFSGCIGLNGNLTIPNNLEHIGGHAFKNCIGLTGLIIGNSVKVIDYNAFEQCTGLTGHLTIPNSVENIGNNAFQNCTGLTGLTMGNNIEKIGIHAFDGCVGLKGHLIIPHSVEYIDGNAFQNCTGLAKLTIGNKVETIQSYAFADCTGLTGDLTIPNNVETIYYRAFYNCTGLKGHLTIGSKVKSMEGGTFYNCAFTSITSLSDTPPFASASDFTGIDKSIPLYVPSHRINAYKNADGWKLFTNIRSIVAK